MTTVTIAETTNEVVVNESPVVVTVEEAVTRVTVVNEVAVTVEQEVTSVTVQQTDIVVSPVEQVTSVTVQPGISDHGLLAGLGDDDHAQYLNGARHSAIGGNPHGVTAADVGAEPDLGDPAEDGYVLSSTAAGARSWVEAASGGISDHGLLSGLGDDDHAQYLNEARHDAIDGNPHGVTAAEVGAEPDLGDPAEDGYVLSSTAAGARSWVGMGAGVSLSDYDNVLVVDPGGDGDYTTIQAAIDSVSPAGGSPGNWSGENVGIFIASGEYKEHVTIKDWVHLVGLGKTTIRPTVGAGLPMLAGTINGAGRATVSNIHFQMGSSNSVSGDDFITTNNNCYFFNCSAHSSWGKPADRSAIEGGTFFNCSFQGSINYLGGVYNSCSFPNNIGEGIGCTFNFCDINQFNFFSAGVSGGSVNYCKVGTVTLAGNTSVATAIPFYGCRIGTLDSTNGSWNASGKTFNFSLCVIDVCQGTQDFHGTINFQQTRIGTVDNTSGNLNGTYNIDSGSVIGTILGSTPGGMSVASGHSFVPVYTDAARPAAGVAGRVIFNSDDGQLNVDDGSNWTLPDGTVT